MLLDVVLAHPKVVWLESAEEKVAHLTTLTQIPVEDLPHAMVGIGARRQLQYFPDRLPLGIHPQGRVVLVYLVADADRDKLADFIQRHTAMLARLPAWTIKVPQPHHPSDAGGDWAEDVLQLLRQPLRDADRGDLLWYFERLKNGHRSTLAAGSDARRARCCATFGRLTNTAVELLSRGLFAFASIRIPLVTCLPGGLQVLAPAAVEQLSATVGQDDERPVATRGGNRVHQALPT